MKKLIFLLILPLIMIQAMGQIGVTKVGPYIKFTGLTTSNSMLVSNTNGGTIFVSGLDQAVVQGTLIVLGNSTQGDGDVVSFRYGELDDNQGQSSATMYVQWLIRNEYLLPSGSDPAVTASIGGTVAVSSIAGGTVDQVTLIPTVSELSNVSSVDLVDAITSITNTVTVSTPAVSSATTLTRPADVLDYAANDAINSSTATPVALEFTSCVATAGEGGYLNEVQIETNAVQFASKTVRLWLYNATPATLTNDNAAMLLDWDDRAKRLGYVDVTFDAVVGASDMVVGRATPMYQFVCATGETSLYGLVQTLSAVTAPTSGGGFYITLHIVQL